jgi:hypothetical protein
MRIGVHISGLLDLFRVCLYRVAVVRPVVNLVWKGIGIAAIVLPLSLAASERLLPAADRLPSTMLWAWERAEDLRWLPKDVGVAYVVTTIELESDRVRTRPRAYPLRVRDDTITIPVVHVDASWRNPPT